MVFLMKRNYEDIPEEETPQFVKKLQELGISLQAYTNGFNDNSHPNVLEDKRKYVSSGENGKKRKLENSPLPSTN